jgi:hypothetical protein
MSIILTDKGSVDTKEGQYPEDEGKRNSHFPAYCTTKDIDIPRNYLSGYNPEVIRKGPSSNEEIEQQDCDKATTRDP